MRKQPSFPIAQVRSLLANGRFDKTGSALCCITGLGFDESMVLSVLCDIDDRSFHKTMPSRLFPGTMLDVYRPLVGAKRMYVKWQIVADADGPLLRVVSFKKDTG